jgi:hypothetical protein
MPTTDFEWTPGYDQARHNVTFAATDDGNGTATKQTSTVLVPILVRNTNRAPLITESANQTMQRGQVLDLPISVNDPDGNQPA